MIGLDTSHVVAFAKLLNDESNPHHVPGGRVTVAYPGGSPDFELSYSRVEGFTQELSRDFGVQIVDAIEQVAEQSDAILLESVDGRVHLEQFRKIAVYGKPVFIDKPLAVSSQDAQEIARLAKEHKVPIMSSSSLRYLSSMTALLELSGEEIKPITGADTYGPLSFQPTQPGYFWYGIHSVEMLFAILGKGCKEVRAFAGEGQDVLVGTWADGRIGTVRGNQQGNWVYGATIHRENRSYSCDSENASKPGYASLLEQVMVLFKTGRSPLDIEETLEVIRFLEAANESREAGGKPVAL
jgi:predicted dehydrogenase